MSLVEGFYVFMTSLLTALIMVPFLCRWGCDAGISFLGTGKTVHTKTIVRVGGIAIGVGFLLSLMIYVDLSREIQGILAGSLIIFLTGLIDDFFQLSPRKKLAAQITGCLTTMAAGRICIHNLGDLSGNGPLHLPLWLAIPLTVIVVLFVMNAINFMDCLDGLAGGISVIALSAFAIHGWLSGNIAATFTCAALLGGVLGFLKYNTFPARIFLGEAGNLGIGFVLAFLGISLTQFTTDPVGPAIPLIVLGVPVVDMLWVIFRRFYGKTNRSGESYLAHHHFLKLGIQPRISVLILYGLSFFWALFSIIFREKSQPFLLTFFLLASLLIYLVLAWLLRRGRLPRFLGNLSLMGVRQNFVYCRTAGFIAHLTPGLFAVILIYFVTAATAGPGCGPIAQKIGAVLVVASAMLLFIARDSGNHFVLAVFCLSGMLLAFAVEQHSSASVLPGVTIGLFVNFLYVAMSLLVALRFFLRRPGELFLTTIDYLVLGSTGLLFALNCMGGAESIIALMIKGIILYMALKIVTLWGSRPRAIVLYSMLVVQFIMVIRGYCGT